MKAQGLEIRAQAIACEIRVMPEPKQAAITDLQDFQCRLGNAHG